MLGLREQVFGDKGYSADLKLATTELDTFRKLINTQWLSTLSNAHPELAEKAKTLGIQNYHAFTDTVNHQQLWPKKVRILPREAVAQIKNLPFFATLKAEFGAFNISDAIDTEIHQGQEEIYWRLVRPNVKTDVGNLHKDCWFHGAANGGYGMFPPEVTTVKIWIPIYCEKGKNGLALLPGSHLKEWRYHIEVIDGMAYPIPDEDLSNVGAELISTDPGNLLIFNEGILHVGVPNCGDNTRVSAEITMVMKRTDQKVYL